MFFRRLPQDNRDKVVIVTFFGKSFWDSNGCKFEKFNALQRKSDGSQTLVITYIIFLVNKCRIYVYTVNLAAD